MNYPNTPAKGRPLTQKASKATVDPHHARDAGNYTSYGITFEKFLQLAFRLSPKEFRELHDKAKSWINGDDGGALFRKHLKEYKAKMASVEGNHYDPFIELWNSVIERMVKTGDVPPERRIKLLNTSSRPIPSDWGTRKPDISVTPEHINYPPRGSRATKAASGGEASTSAGSAQVEPATTNTMAESGMGGQRTSGRLRTSVKRTRPLTPENATDVDYPDRSDGEYVDVNATHDIWTFISWLVILAIFEFKSAGRGPPLVKNTGKAGKGKMRETTQDSSRTSKRHKAHGEDTGGDAPGNGFVGGSNKALKATIMGGINESSNTTLVNSLPHVWSVGQALDGTKAVGLTNVDAQIAAYVAEMKSARGDRKHTFSAGVNKLKMWLYFHSNSGIIRSNAIDFERKPECVALYLSLFMLRPLGIIGFNDLSGFHNPFCLKDIETLKITLDIAPLPNGNTRETQPILKDTRLGEMIDTQYYFLGRATTVYRLILAEDDNLVAKVCWEPIVRRREEEMIMAAREVDPLHTPEIFGSSVVPVDTPFVDLRDACRVKSPMFEVRHLRLLVMQEYTPITRITVGSDFVDAMHQLLTFLHSLYKERQLLHRDIGIHNLTYYTSADGKVVVVPIDYGLAFTPLIGAPAPTADHLSVNFPFSAFEILQKPGCAHKLHHDLESVLYCSVWYGLGYRQGKPFPLPLKKSRLGRHLDDHLKEWRTGDVAEVARAKLGFLTMPSASFLAELEFIDNLDVRTFCSTVRNTFYLSMVNNTKVTYSSIMQGIDGQIPICQDQCCPSSSVMPP